MPLHHHLGPRSHEDRPLLPTGCSFDAPDWYLMARCWFPVMRSEDLRAAPQAVRLLDQPLVLYRAAGSVVAAADACPHRGVPLSMGTADPCGIRCRYHGLLFGAEGRCLDVPCQPGHPVQAQLHLRTYPTVERYGLLWTCLWPQEGVQPDIPVMPHWDEAGFQQAVCPCYPMDCFAGHQLEGFIDVAHLPWVHAGTFADPDRRGVPSYDVHHRSDGFAMDYDSDMPNYPVDSGRRAPEGHVWRRHFEVHPPFAASLTLHFPGADRAVVMNVATPVSALRTHLFCPVSRNFDTDRPAEEMIAFNLRVFDEDRALTEAQRPRNLPLDVRVEAHTRADRITLAHRRRLLQLGYRRFFADVA